MTTADWRSRETARSPFGIEPIVSGSHSPEAVGEADRAATRMAVGDRVPAHPGVVTTDACENSTTWGGTTTVSTNATHLTCAAGNKMVAMVSPGSAPALSELGAGTVFGHGRPTGVDDVVADLRGSTIAAASANRVALPRATLELSKRASARPAATPL